MGKLYLVLVLLLWQLAAASALAGEPAVRLRTGRAFDQQLSSTLDITWANIPLGRALRSLSHSQHVAIVLDRRIDPQRKLNLTFSRETVQNVVDKIAEQVGGRIAILGSVIYLGPPEAAAELRAQSNLRNEDLKFLPAPRQKALSGKQAWHWAELATPRDLVEILAREARVDVRGLDKIPHDLWPACDLPPLAWTDRLSLIAVQFDLTFRVLPGGKSVELVAIPTTPEK